MERPNKHSAMIVHEERPFNAEPPLTRPRQSLLTPKDLFFSRNHGSIPELDPEGYRLVVGGLVDRPLELSMGDLYGLPKMEVVAVLQCAGNRRNGLMQSDRTVVRRQSWGDGPLGGRPGARKVFSSPVTKQAPFSQGYWEPDDPVVLAAEQFVRWSNRSPGRTYDGSKTIDTSTQSAKRLRMTR